MVPTATPSHHSVQHHTATTAMDKPKPATRAQQLRKIKKPILEKKRRDRINKSLDELKDLMLKVYNKDVSEHKLEKADILELAVQYLHMVNSGSVVGGGLSHDLFHHYRSGYDHCLQEVSRYLQQQQQATPPSSTACVELQHRLLQHCQDKLVTAAPLSPGLSPGIPELVTPAYHAHYRDSSAQQQLQEQQLQQQREEQGRLVHLHHQQLLLQQQQQHLLFKHQLCEEGPGGSSMRSSCSPAHSDVSCASECMWRPW